MADTWNLVRAGDTAEWRDQDGEYTQVPLGERLALKKMRANLFLFRPGQRMEYHNHDWQEELFYVVRGQCVLVVEGERRPLYAGDFARIAPQPRRQIVNEGTEDCLWLAVGAPPVDDEWSAFAEDTAGDPPPPSGSWAVKNVSELDEKARDRYLITWLREPLGLQSLRANLFRFRQGDSMYLHAHKVQEELFFVVSGEAELVVGDERRRVGPLDIVRVDKEPMRQLIQTGDADTVWLAVGAPPVGDDTIWSEE